MCLALVAFDAHPRFALVVAANRDEYHARPTAPARWWSEGILAGRDLSAGGTWLGLSREGRFALLTNVRDPSRHDPRAASRGPLVPRVLDAEGSLAERLERVRADGGRHNGFNLLAGSAHDLGWMSNRSPAVRLLGRGIYGVSNASLDIAWPKVERTKRALARWSQEGRDDLEALFATLADRAPARDEELPSTGVTLAWERLLSAPFIVDDRYGTRSTTVLTIDRDGEARFVERSFDAKGDATGEIVERFVLAAPPMQTAGPSGPAVANVDEPVSRAGD